MNNQEAKFVLGAYRPGGQDAGDPAMAQALEQAKNDPALGAWFAREQAHDAAVTAKLREVTPPAGLRAAILTGAKVSGVAGRAARAEAKSRQADAREGRAMTSQAWWRQPVWLAAAAAVALLLTVLAGWRLMPVRGNTFEEFAVNFVDRGFRLPKHSEDIAVLKTWLSEQHGPLPEALPAKFAELQALGCKKLEFRGHDVSLMCFERGGKEFHVFVARLDDVGRGQGSGTSEATAPRFIDEAKVGLVAATWFDAKNRYVVVSDAGMAALKGVL